MRRPAVQLMQHSSILWLIFVLLETAAQLALKKAAMSADHMGIWQSVHPIVTNPWFVGSIACNAFKLLVWLALLGRQQLSVAVPIPSMTYFSVLLAAEFFLHEPMQTAQLGGLVLIGVGLTLVTWGDGPVTLEE
jgi:drug/metabolite transporter (DMT)-like permease